MPNIFNIIETLQIYFTRELLPVASHFNVNKWRPCLVVSCYEEALSTGSAAPPPCYSNLCSCFSKSVTFHYVGSRTAAGLAVLACGRMAAGQAACLLIWKCHSTSTSLSTTVQLPASVADRWLNLDDVGQTDGMQVKLPANVGAHRTIS